MRWLLFFSLLTACEDPSLMIEMPRGCEQTTCDGACVDLETDTNNCGACGTDCSWLGWTVDGCVEGRCVCGAVGDQPCDQGMRCGANGCESTVCNLGSCADGCCDSTGACYQASMAACGSLGGTCTDCSAMGDRVDQCVDGGCACSASGVACADGETCTAEGCRAMCGPTACANEFTGRVDSCSGSGDCVCAATGAACGDGGLCAADGCHPPSCSCANGTCYILPIVYEKSCDLRDPLQCDLLTQSSDSFAPYQGTQVSFVEFDLSVLPSTASVTDALFFIYPASGATVWGGSVALTNAPFDGSVDAVAGGRSDYTWVDELFGGGSELHTSDFGLTPCEFGACSWLRARDQRARSPTTIADGIQGWIDGTIPPNGLLFFANGPAASTRAAPGLTLAVCIE